MSCWQEWLKISRYLGPHPFSSKVNKSLDAPSQFDFTENVASDSLKDQLGSLAAEETVFLLGSANKCELALLCIFSELC